jgi:ubiquinone/menaquinone biosynthesis C-methylase UbiE
MNTWKDIWTKRKKLEVNNLTHNDLFKLNGFDGLHSSINEDTIIPALTEYSKKMNLFGDESIYEIGCGAGAFLYHWHTMNHHVGGCDISESLLEYADKAIPNRTWECIEANKLNVKDKYDHVISFSTFFYFPNYVYAKEVVYRMIMKANKSISIFDIPDLELKKETESFRKETIPNYEESYADLKHLYYPKEWWTNIANELGLTAVIYNQNIKGYNNSEWRYNVTISL